MNPVVVAKYFRRCPPPPLDPGGARHAVVIPAYDETAELPATLATLRRAAGSEAVAVIAVVNHPPGADPAASLELLEFLRTRREVHPLYLPDLPGGVGAARKAGMDAFLAAMPPESLERSAVFSLDADTHVEPDYFAAALPAVLAGGAVTFRFRHRAAETPEQQSAIDRYEAYLRRYADKLRFAGSPYAFVAVGSAFAVRGDAYIRAGGMKARAAGEDFYFLQAAAKTSGVRELPDVTVHPSPRVSRRVPFGTGPAVAALLAGQPLPEIPDAAFSALRTVLTGAKDAVLTDGEAFLAGMPEKSAEFFRREKFPAVWTRVRRNLPDRSGAATRAFHEWFDGLKTLRFLHFYADFSEKTT